MDDKKKKILAAIEKMRKDKQEVLSALKEGKSVAEMEKEGLRFLNSAK